MIARLRQAIQKKTQKPEMVEIEMKEMKTGDTTITGLPADVINYAIAPLLSPKDIFNLSAVASILNRRLSQDSIWKAKMRLHFPRDFERLCANSDVNWRKQFKKSYIKNYGGLEDRTIKIYSLIKEGDLSRLKQEIELTPSSLIPSVYDPAPYYNKFGLTSYSHEPFGMYDDAEIRQPCLNYLYQRETTIKKTNNRLIPSYFHRDRIARPLHAATFYNQSDEEIMAILSKGSTVDDRNDILESPLHLAASRGNIRIARLLLSQHADIHSQTIHGYTPLHYAAYFGHCHMAELLINGSANIDAGNNRNVTPLYLACEQGHTNMADLLLRRGADANIFTVAGLRPIHIASHQGHTEIVKLLGDYKTDINVFSRNSHNVAHGFDESRFVFAYVTPLCLALYRMRDKTTLTLLEMGADIHKVAYLTEDRSGIFTERREPFTVSALEYADYRTRSLEVHTRITEILQQQTRINLDKFISDTKVRIDHGQSYQNTNQNASRFFSFFNRQIGYSEQDYYDAAVALRDYWDKKSNSIDIRHKGALSQGELGNIFNILLNPKPYFVYERDKHTFQFSVNDKHSNCSP